MTYTFPKRSLANTATERPPLRSPLKKPTWTSKPGRTPGPEQPEPLEMSQIVDYFKSGCKPQSQWRIGTEHEKFVFNKADASRATYEEVRYILDQVVARHGWEPMMEGDNILGCLKDGKSITIEAGGQVELSGSPLWDLHQTANEVASHLREVRAIAAEIGVGFLGCGVDPLTHQDDIEYMPKRRYGMLDRYLISRNGDPALTREWLASITSTQVNLDYASEADMVDKLRIGLALQPAAIALFANSAFRRGREASMSCWRSNTYLSIDPSRCGMLPFVFSPDFGFEAYAEWALDAPMILAYRGGTELECRASSFRDFIPGRMAEVPGEVATISDFADHLGTLWPEVRMKKFLEMRGADCGSEEMIVALPALWVGLLYDTTAREECLRLIENWSVEDMAAQRRQVPVTGLQSVVRGTSMAEVVAEMVRIAHGGLRRRGLGEGMYLRPLDEIVARGKTEGDVAAELFRNEWNGSTEALMEHLAL